MKVLGKVSIGLAAALVLFVITGSILGLTGALGEKGFFDIILPLNRNANESNPAVLVTASIMDDLAAHTIQIPGEDGQEISLQRGRTLIVIMDYNSTYKGEHVREIRYE